MRSCVALFISLLFLASYAQTFGSTPGFASIVTDRLCFEKGEQIRARFENVNGTGVWIGLYPKESVNNFGSLPKFLEGKLSDWILTCSRRDNCLEWPSNGNIQFATDKLDYGEYVITVSGDQARLNSQAHSERFIVDAHCPNPHRWIPPHTKDQRSPCPFVNTIANHGFINRNGTNIDISDMADKLEMVYNIVSEFLRQGPIQQIIDCNQTYEDENGVMRFDLDVLFDDNCEEHEASMVRADSFFGFEKSKKIDDRLLNNLMRRNRGKIFLTFDDIMDYQAERIMTSRMENPKTNFRHFDVDNMGAQGIFLFLLSSDKTMMTVEKNRLYFFLLEERLPDDFVLGALRDTPFNPKDSSDFVHDRLMLSMSNVETMMKIPIDEAFINTQGLYKVHSQHVN